MSVQLSRRVALIMGTPTIRSRMSGEFLRGFATAVESADAFSDLPLEYQRLILEAEDELKEAE